MVWRPALDGDASAGRDGIMTAQTPRRFFNRELSWLEFNQRVLDQAMAPSTPLLERLKFFCISASNLDEFFEVRVAGLKQEIETEAVVRSLDGFTASEGFRAVQRRVRRMVDLSYRCWREDLAPALAEHGFRFHAFGDLRPSDREWVGHYYASQVRPVLTPLAIDSSHPFPQLLNKSINLIVRLGMEQDGVSQERLAVVQVPRILPRLVRLPRADGSHDYVMLGRLIGSFLPDLFPGTTIEGHWLFRVTRNSELYIDEEEAENLLRAVERELHNRRRGDAVRLELEQGCPEAIQQKLLKTLRLAPEDLYLIDGPLHPQHLATLLEGDHSPELRDAPFVPVTPKHMQDRAATFGRIREGDLLLHHPYESFDPVAHFLEEAAADPDVLAIKQTLYRTGGSPRITGALMRAAKAGKQVTVVVELRARFDEANNILWAGKLEDAGVHVVYGLVGYKIHCKLCLVVRRDPDGIRRYLHLATGNYNPSTAKLYTDLSFFTCKPDFGEDATELFNLLTGICQFKGTRKLIVAPFDLHRRMLALIEREAASALKGLPARIIAKMNSLADPEIIQALCKASQAGVKIDLVVRGVCCLVPGVRGLSENIQVRSIVDRFLEHSRVFYFENGCRPEVFLGSADFLPRNFFKRIEVVFPVEDGNLRERVVGEILRLNLEDNSHARLLDSDGTYRPVPVKPGEAVVRAQSEFIRLARLQKAPTSREVLAGGHPKMTLRPRPERPPKPARRRTSK